MMIVTMLAMLVYVEPVVGNVGMRMACLTFLEISELISV